MHKELCLSKTSGECVDSRSNVIGPTVVLVVTVCVCQLWLCVCVCVCWFCVCVLVVTCVLWLCVCAGCACVCWLWLCVLVVTVCVVYSVRPQASLRRILLEHCKLSTWSSIGKVSMWFVWLPNWLRSTWKALNIGSHWSLWTPTIYAGALHTRDQKQAKNTDSLCMPHFHQVLIINCERGGGRGVALPTSPVIWVHEPFLVRHPNIMGVVKFTYILHCYHILFKKKLQLTKLRTSFSLSSS